MKKNRFTLSQYSGFAVSFLLLNNSAKTQVIYTDIDPDVILDLPMEGYGLDMDHNGTVDFAFLNSSFTFINSYSITYWTRQDIIAGPYIVNNAIAGDSRSYSISGSKFTVYFPYALNAEIKIGSSLSWQNNAEQFMGLVTFYHSGEDTFSCIGCHWYNHFVPETLDHYLGVNFIDSDGLGHYGWIRCDVKDTGRTLVIKDYAYELQPDKPILAGDTVSYVNIENNGDALNATIYSFNKNVCINIPEIKNETEIHIYDILGKEIYTANTQQPFTEIRIDGAEGFYLVELISGENKYSQKVFVN